MFANTVMYDFPTLAIMTTSRDDLPNLHSLLVLGFLGSQARVDTRNAGTLSSIFDGAGRFCLPGAFAEQTRPYPFYTPRKLDHTKPALACSSGLLVVVAPLLMAPRNLRIVEIATYKALLES